MVSTEKFKDHESNNCSLEVDGFKHFSYSIELSCHKLMAVIKSAIARLTHRSDSSQGSDYIAIFISLISALGGQNFKI